VARRQLDALRRHEVDVRIVQRRQCAVHGVEHAFILLRPGDREHVRIGFLDLLGFRAHATGDNDLAVFGHGFADGAQRLLLGAVEKAAGIDDHQIRAVVLARQFIPFRAEAGDDPFGIHQRLGAAK
jgi:hypothetical protein